MGAEVTALGAYLLAACGRPWVWGGDDCCTLPGDWAQTWDRGDPMAEWRGRYSTEAEAEDLIFDAGGLLELWERGLASIGVEPVKDIQPGDVGVIWALGMTGEPEQVGALWSGRRWAFRAPTGVFFASAEPVRVWGARG